MFNVDVDVRRSSNTDELPQGDLTHHPTPSMTPHTTHATITSQLYFFLQPAHNLHPIINFPLPLTYPPAGSCPVFSFCPVPSPQSPVPSGTNALPTTHYSTAHSRGHSRQHSTAQHSSCAVPSSYFLHCTVP